MPQTLTHKILGEHLVDGSLTPGSEIGIRIDQTLTQDATGTTAFLLFEAMDVPRVRAELSVSYVDHNMAQFGPANHNDHLYLQTVARRFGAVFSRPGNGICHQVHLERFGRPGKTLLGSDSHTPTGGGLGMIAIGAGGLDVAAAMAGGPFYLTCPRVVAVELRRSLQPWVAAKDIILTLLGVLTTRGNVGCVVEYVGEGLAGLPVPARATCTNMGAELGVTTSIFPADAVTEQFLAAQGRGDHYRPMAADADCVYDTVTKRLHRERDAAALDALGRTAADLAVSEADADGFVEASFSRIVLDLSQIEPMAAVSPSPDNVHPVRDLAGKAVSQVLIGSCTNSSVRDLILAATVLAGRTVHPDVELGIAPGSRQALATLAHRGGLTDLIRAGARVLEAACGPCIGLGFSPADGTVSVRTFNRNFAGRTGTANDEVVLVSPETALAAALTGELTDPRTLPDALGIDAPDIRDPEEFSIDDRMVVMPPAAADAAAVTVRRGPTIVKPPPGEPLPETLTGTVLIKVGDKLTTDDIMPAGSLLKHRSNVPAYAQFVFHRFNQPDAASFAERALAAGTAGQAGVIVAGDSYGQGSSREHAALCPMFLGVRVVIAKAIERIHQANLVNFGILPLVFATPADYENIREGNDLRIESVLAAVADADEITVENVTQGRSVSCRVVLSARQRRILAAGGLLNAARDNA